MAWKVFLLPFLLHENKMFPSPSEIETISIYLANNSWEARRISNSTKDGLFAQLSNWCDQRSIFLKNQRIIWRFIFAFEIWPSKSNAEICRQRFVTFKRNWETERLTLVVLAKFSNITTSNFSYWTNHQKHFKFHMSIYILNMLEQDVRGSLLWCKLSLCIFHLPFLQLNSIK